jgi:hypothetical protein
MHVYGCNGDNEFDWPTSLDLASVQDLTEVVPGSGGGGGAPGTKFG